MFKLIRYGVVEKEFFDKLSLDRYAVDNIGVPVNRLSAYGYTIKEERGA